MSDIIYKYFNNNPKGRITGDCGARAMALFSGLDWEDIVRLSGKYYLNTGKHLFSHRTDLGILDNPLTSLPCTPVLNLKQRSIKDFIENKAKDKYVYLLLLPGHLTVVMDNMLHDICDCTDGVFINGLKMKRKTWEKLQKDKEETLAKIEKSFNKKKGS